MADTQKSGGGGNKQGAETARAGAEAGAGGVLHQRRNLPFSPMTMTIAGVAITGAVVYFTLYVKKKPEATAADVARVTTGTADTQNTSPRP